MSTSTFGNESRPTCNTTKRNDEIGIKASPSVSSRKSNLSKYANFGDEALKQGNVEAAVNFYMKSVRILAPKNVNEDHLDLERCKEYCIMTSTLLKICQAFLRDSKNDGAHTSLQTAEVLIRKVVDVTIDKENDAEGDFSMVKYSAVTLLSKVMEARGDTYLLDGDLTLSEITFQEAISYKRKSLTIIGTESKVAKVFNDTVSINLELVKQLKKFAGVLQKRGDFDESAKVYNDALMVRQGRVDEKCHEEVLDILNCLADVYRHNGEIASALQCVNNLQHMCVDNEEAKDTIFKNMLKRSELLVMTEDYTSAMADATSALEMANSEGFEYNERLLRRAAATEQVARILEARKHLHDAVIWHKRCQSIRSLVLSETHKLALKSTRQIANIYCKEGEHDIAKEMYKEMRDKLVEKHGVEHSSMADLLDDLGCVYAELKDISGAIKCHKKALQIRIKCHAAASTPASTTSSSSDLAVTLEKLARLYLKTNRSQGMYYFSETLTALRQSHFCPRHPAVIRTIHEMTTYKHDEDELESTSVFLQLSKWNGIGSGVCEDLS